MFLQRHFCKQMFCINVEFASKQNHDLLVKIKFSEIKVNLQYSSHMAAWPHWLWDVER